MRKKATHKIEEIVDVFKQRKSRLNSDINQHKVSPFYLAVINECFIKPCQTELCSRAPTTSNLFTLALISKRLIRSSLIDLSLIHGKTRLSPRQVNKRLLKEIPIALQNKPQINPTRQSGVNRFTGITLFSMPPCKFEIEKLNFLNKKEVINALQSASKHLRSDILALKRSIFAEFEIQIFNS